MTFREQFITYFQTQCPNYLAKIEICSLDPLSNIFSCHTQVVYVPVMLIGEVN